MSPTSDDSKSGAAQRVRFVVSATTAVKFGFFAALGMTAFAVLMGGLAAAVAVGLAAAGFFTLPVLGR